MNPSAILQTLNNHGVDYLLIGRVNFLFRHRPVLTYDTDVWVADFPDNLSNLNRALLAIGAEWGETDAAWGPVPTNAAWLLRQGVSMTTRHGPLDIFRAVRGLEGSYERCKATAISGVTQDGIAYRGLCDEDMLACQEALPEGSRNVERIRFLQAALAAKREKG